MFQEPVNESTDDSERGNGNENAKTLPLADIKITNQNVALNFMIQMIAVAQKRGSFSIQESAKIWECIQFFAPKNNETSSA